MSDLEDTLSKRSPPELAEQQSRYVQKLQFQASKLAERIKQGKVSKSSFKITQRCAQAHTDAVLGCVLLEGEIITYSIDGSLKRWSACGKSLELSSCECFDSGIISVHLAHTRLCVLTANGEVFADGVPLVRTGIVACFSWFGDELLICTRQGQACVLGAEFKQTNSFSLQINCFSDRPTACLLLQGCCYIGFQGGRIQRFILSSEIATPAEQIQLHPNTPVISLLPDSKIAAYPAVVQEEAGQTPLLIISAQRDKSVQILNHSLGKSLLTLFCGELQNGMGIEQGHLILFLETKVKFYKLANLLTSECAVKSSFGRPLIFCAQLEHFQWLLGNSRGDLELVEVDLALNDDVQSEQL